MMPRVKMTININVVINKERVRANEIFCVLLPVVLSYMQKKENDA